MKHKGILLKRSEGCGKQFEKKRIKMANLHGQDRPQKTKPITVSYAKTKHAISMNKKYINIKKCKLMACTFGTGN